MMRIRWGKVLLAFLVIWILILIYLLVPLWPAKRDLEDQLAKKLKDAHEEISRLSKENIHLQMSKKIHDKGGDSANVIEEPSNKELDNHENRVLVKDEVAPPSKEYEMNRRQMIRDTNEMWWYIRSKLELADKKFGGSANRELSTWFNQTLVETQHHQKAVLLDLAYMSEVDGHNDWRLQEAKDLEDLVQNRLKSLQNPKDCGSAKKLLCNLNKGCGYGCQLHHAVYCFIVAYGTQRTLILKSKGWRYNRNGYEEIFQPLSDTCHEATGQKKSLAR